MAKGPNGDGEIALSYENFFGVVGILTGFVCLLLSGFLVAVPSKRKTSNLFLAAFLTLTAIELSIWVWGGWQAGGDGELIAVWRALGRLQMPAFFFFFLSACYSDLRLKRHDLLHLLPALLCLLLAVPGGPGGGFLAGLFDEWTHQGWAVSQLIYFGYMAAILVLLWRFKAQFRMHHSGGRSQMLVWLVQLAAASLFARLIILSRDLIGPAISPEFVLVLQVIGASVALSVMSWIALKSLMQPELFRDVDRRLLRSPDAASNGQADAARLKRHMDTEQPYLDPELTLSGLAEQVALTPRELSELLNQSLGLHFFDFVNMYRVEHAKAELLATPKQSVLTVLYASGFNSKSSFNTAFRKHVGMTPSEYRRTAVAAPSKAFDFA
ncbi:helix-turn-helix domain-containing protein [Henriciella sp. AS95]|uniref:helix-turn-helix domain-containing protein n=1 Tax=Henriciella sp. AS95 TaxID=3135782 RepID=UPI003171C560